MLSKPRLTLLRSLRQKKFRTEHGLFVAEGEKLVQELLNSQFVVTTVYATKDWLKKNSRLLKKAGEILEITDEDLSRISSLVTPQEVLAVAIIPEYELDDEYLLNNYSLLLDGIRDPGNMGTIIRIADWFGIRNIICSPDCAEVWNPKVVQASMGSLLRVHVHESEPEEFFTRLKKSAREKKSEFPVVYGTFMNGENIYATKFQKTGIVVIGNEANGIRPETEKLITKKITIPAWPGNRPDSRPESLNAAIATAIVCSEIRRT
ncbi:MAG TPA: RNA methyltransferase [Bacteroidia bacterium]|nr:RNA methyltransferase [Bacteroidia bacterium]